MRLERHRAAERGALPSTIVSGRRFLDWYSGSLKHHATAVLQLAQKTFPKKAFWAKPARHDRWVPFMGGVAGVECLCAKNIQSRCTSTRRVQLLQYIDDPAPGGLC